MMHPVTLRRLIAGLLCLLMLCGALSSCVGNSLPMDTSTVDTEDDQTIDTATDTDTEKDVADATTAVSTDETQECHTSATEVDPDEPEVTDPDVSETDSTSIDESESDSESVSESESESETQPPIPPEQTPKAEMPYIEIWADRGQSIVSKDTYVDATVNVGGCEDQYRMNGAVAGVRLRGNSTFVAPKKPYRIKFETKQGMLGLNDGRKYKSWCLMADYYDQSMLRTWATFSFAEILMERKYYSSDSTPVELYVNGTYMGVYLLCEQSQINPGRVDIDEKQDGETSVEIGYLMIGQGGRTDEPESIVITPEITVWDRNGDAGYFGNMNFALSGSGYTQAQKDYVTAYTSAVFKVVAAALYENKYYNLDRNGNMTLRSEAELAGMTTEERQIDTIDAVFNIEAAVRMCVLDEIVKNLDAMTFNMYVDLSPRGDGRLTLAAPWDFDFSMANTHYSVLHSTTGFYATNLSVSDGMRTNVWFVMLGRIGWFEDMCREVWQAHYDELKSVADEVLIRTYRYSEAYDRDWETWGRGRERMLIGHHCTADLNTFDRHADVGHFLHDWLTARLRWLNRQWGDGTQTESAPGEPLLMVDFTNPASMSYISGAKRCYYRVTEQGLHLSLTAEARDPYFYVDYTTVSGLYSAEDYYILEIEYMMPVSNSQSTYEAEFFLCTGSQWGAVAGVSTMANIGRPDGEYHTLRIDLSRTAFWDGDIHKIRFDFFHSCVAGDQMIVRSFKLLPGS